MSVSDARLAQIAARFADRKDCIVEGPLSFDVAMEPAAAKEKQEEE